MVEFCADADTFAHVFKSESVLNALMAKYFGEKGKKKKGKKGMWGKKGKKQGGEAEGSYERDDIYVSAEINVRRAARYLVKNLQMKCEEMVVADSKLSK